MALEILTFFETLPLSGDGAEIDGMHQYSFEDDAVTPVVLFTKRGEVPNLRNREQWLKLRETDIDLLDIRQVEANGSHELTSQDEIRKSPDGKSSVVLFIRHQD